MIIGIVVGLLVLGLALLAVELFVIPGFGLIGVLGAVACLAGAGVAFTQLSPGAGVAAVGVAVVVAGGLAWLLPTLGFGRSMVLDETQRGGRATDGTLAGLVGAEGAAVTPLRPSGHARFGERVVDVVADGIYVEVGARVRVARVEGSRVLVEPVPLS